MCLQQRIIFPDTGAKRLWFPHMLYAGRGVNVIQVRVYAGKTPGAYQFFLVKTAIWLPELNVPLGRNISSSAIIHAVLIVTG